MSYTGNVIRPQKSPGLIEIVTCGHGVFNIDGKITLVYSRPHEDWPRRLVPFRGPEQIQTGDYVRFKLVSFEELPKDLIMLENKIRTKIPEFAFQYIAEEVDRIQDRGRPYAIRPIYSIFTAQEQDVEGKILVDFDFVGGLDTSNEIEINKTLFKIEDVKIVDRSHFEELSESYEAHFVIIDQEDILLNEQIPQWICY